jgi:O-antigen/teichoic acid export membrane protein
MRLKPGTLTEASAVFSLGWFLILIGFIAIAGDIGKAVSAATLSLIFLLPCYTLWGLLGLAVRKRTRNVKFFMNISISSVIILGGAFAMKMITDSYDGPRAEAETALSYISAIAAITYLSVVCASAFTYFWLTKSKKGLDSAKPAPKKEN